MAIRGTKRRRAADKGFALSDHADWQGLNDAVKETGAERIYVTHGYSSQFSRWLCDLGYDAKPVETMFEGESAEILETDQAEEEKLADNPIAEE
jgi:putative mRNA 3-end processing factor